MGSSGSRLLLPAPAQPVIAEKKAANKKYLP
jgi:hypothetical protein